jgi:hypothetical protein
MFKSILIDGLSRTQQTFHSVLAGIGADDANWQPTPTSNSITWLAWHAAREIDLQIAGLAETADVWTSQGWVDRFALDLPRDAHGYGQTTEEAARVVVADTTLLAGYYDAVVAAANEYISSLTEQSLAEVIDRSWDPPVTRAVRIVSIIEDAAQHAGQAAYLKGLLAALGDCGDDDGEDDGVL